MTQECLHECLFYNFSVVKNFKKECNPADFKFYLGKVINKYWEMFILDLFSFIFVLFIA